MGEMTASGSASVPVLYPLPQTKAQECPEVPRAGIKFRYLNQAGDSTSQSACGLQGTIPRPAALTDVPLDFVRNASSGDLLLLIRNAAYSSGLQRQQLWTPLLGRDILSKVHASVFMTMEPSLSL